MKEKANDAQVIAFCKVMRKRFSRGGINALNYYFTKWKSEYYVSGKQNEMITKTYEELKRK